MQNFHYVNVLLDMMYGIDLDDADIEEYGLIAWELIGNRTRKLYRYTAQIDPAELDLVMLQILMEKAVLNQ